MPDTSQSVSKRSSAPAPVPRLSWHPGRPENARGIVVLWFSPLLRCSVSQQLRAVRLLQTAPFRSSRRPCFVVVRSFLHSGAHHHHHTDATQRFVTREGLRQRPTQTAEDGPFLATKQQSTIGARRQWLVQRLLSSRVPITGVCIASVRALRGRLAFDQEFQTKILREHARTHAYKPLQSRAFVPLWCHFVTPPGESS